VADNGSFLLPDEVVTVAEELKELGMSTGAVIASFVLHRQFGLDQGFDTYDDSLLHGWKRDAAGYDEMRASGVSDRALAWIGQNAGKRWFLWLHYYDPHAEYEPPPAYQQTGSHPYDGEIAYVDHELGRVLADLEKNGLRERTLVILTSDHGESLGEHGEQTHGLFLYEAAMRVPLIVSLPGATPAGKVVTQRVSLMDVAPTVFSVLGRTPPKQIQGRSFMHLLFSDTPDREEAPVILETRLPWYSYGWSPSSAIVADNFKFIKAPKPELYNLRVDPEELENLYHRDRARAETMASRLETLRAGFGEASLERKSRVQMDEVTRDRLANLGYISSGPPSGKPEKPADVKDRIEELNRIKWAAALHASGNEDEALSILEELVAKSTDNRTALKRLGVWYMQKSEYTKAEKHLKHLIQLDPELVEAYYNLCQIYADSSRFDEASLLAQTVLSKFPRSARAHGLMGNIRLQEKDYGSALEHLNKAIEYYARYHEALANRGLAYYSMGEHEKALADMRRASRIDPGNRRYIRYVEQLEKTAKRSQVGVPGAEGKN
jgi:tetratricopeptide (TPR) repeat protein